MNLESIKELIELISKSAIDEFELEAEGFKVAMRKLSAAVRPAPVTVQAEPAPAPAAPAPAAESKAPAKDDRFVQITAPMVGTFYRAPAPDAEPYVKVGDIVEVGQTLCIIEAMKLMNEIESEVRGRVTEILVENAQPVEYGQPLFVLEKL
ncbi:MAG: acetyl-CoA carboxylase, biotin carboxyl carrier protein [Firmicutes bacterium ZCTH02-B6]|nr:MAG: acetyl-CoA carboxylase, biotin carboxyl carrier protein [Firmicutes bacterium ZCTH02-B6]